MSVNTPPGSTPPVAPAPAVPAGFTIQPTINEAGRTVYQLFDASGEYIASGTSEAALLKRAEKRGLLPSE